MNMNPYITKVETKILKKKLVNDKVHVALQDDLSLDYEGLNAFKEDLYINNHKVEDTYMSSYGRVFVSDYNPESEFITLSVNSQDRNKLLKSFTLRYLIFSSIKKYLNLKVYGFATDKNNSSFRIDKVFYEYQVREIINLLERIIPIYIESGLDIKRIVDENGETTLIKGIYEGKQLGHHLSNLSEIKDFEISHYTFGKNGITIYYHN